MRGHAKGRQQLTYHARANSLGAGLSRPPLIAIRYADNRRMYSVAFCRTRHGDWKKYRWRAGSALRCGPPTRFRSYRPDISTFKEADMTRLFLALPLTVLALLVGTTPAAAQDTKTTRGTVTAMTGTQVTVQVAGTAMNFAYDAKTVVEARGAGTASKQAAAASKAGPVLSEVLKTGQSVEVTYRETGGAMHATIIRAISASGATPSMAKSSTGKVTAVSATSLTINGSSGGGASFTQTFAIGATTKVVGKGVGTAAASSGGRTVATDLVHTGDSVHVSFRDMDGKLLADTVTVTSAAAPK
jgi:hypothetical protein